MDCRKRETLKNSPNKSQANGIIQKWGDTISIYAYFLLWVANSAVLICFNKYIMTKGGFPHPISLTFIHMVSSFVFASIANIFGVVKPDPIPFDIFKRCILPIAAVQALVLWFGNAAYLTLSVPFIQMLKATAPVAVFIVGVIFRTHPFEISTALNMVVIAAGVALVAYGEILFELSGFLFQMASTVLEAIRIVLIQLLLTSSGMKIGSVTALQYVAPACAVFMLGPLLYFEQGALQSLQQVNVIMLVANTICAFALNISSYLFIGKAGALTMRALGPIKDWIVIGTATAASTGPVFTFYNIAGAIIAFSGVIWYNATKVLRAQNTGADATSANSSSTASLSTTSADVKSVSSTGDLMSVVVSESVDGSQGSWPRDAASTSPGSDGVIGMASESAPLLGNKRSSL